MENKTKILIVDDYLPLLEMLNESLVNSGYDVVYTNDGAEATNIFTTFNPDIVLTDIVMPGVDGIELILDLRKINASIKVVAMSGGNSGRADTYLNMAKKLGANKIIPKPFKVSELLKQLDSLVA
ncbi:MAG: response regulator [Gammaproteobacteria bacterium]|nr:response regulator [Gammaproteobacteria bacterium]